MKLATYIIINLISFPVVITLFLWALSKNSLSEITLTPFRSISQVLGLMGFVLVAINLFLTTRNRLAEAIFNGLDKMYLNHHTIGIIAFTLLVNHPLFQILNLLPNNLSLAHFFFFPSDILANDFGIFAMYVLLLAFLFIFLIKLPYQTWKFTHQFLGLTFALASIHMLLISSDVSNFIVLRLWMIAWATVGCVSAFYTIFLYQSKGPHYRYTLSKLDKLGDIYNLYLKPTNGANKTAPLLQFTPGQFGFVSFRNRAVGFESHPFSFSKSPDKEVRFSVKAVGDYTKRLDQLSQGDSATIYGPYGMFGQNLKSKSDLIWIAGGIGVTPFLSMLSNEGLQRPNSNRQIYFFYSTRTEKEAVFTREIKKKSQALPNLHFFPWISQKQGHLNAPKILELTGELTNYRVMICGPLIMMETLKEQFLHQGLTEDRIIFENFAIR